MSPTKSAAIAAVLSAAAGSALAGIETVDVVLGFETAGLARVALDHGTATQSPWSGTAFDASGTIAMTVSIDNGELVNATLTGGSYTMMSPISVMVDDDGTAAEFALDAISVDLGSAASSVQFTQGSAGFDLSFLPASDLTGSVAASENGIAKGLIDLGTEQSAVVPEMFGLLRLDGDTLTFETKFSFDGSGFDAGLTSGRTFGYEMSSTINAVGTVPTPGSVLLACSALGLAARRRR